VKPGVIYSFGLCNHGVVEHERIIILHRVSPGAIRIKPLNRGFMIFTTIIFTY